MKQEIYTQTEKLKKKLRHLVIAPQVILQLDGPKQDPSDHQNLQTLSITGIYRE
jgi:hypothetical protein